MKRILFRADSSSAIGTGHIMRDLVLAEQFEDADIIFATQALPGHINHKIEEKGYTLLSLAANSAEELIDVITKNRIEMLVIDHYGIDQLCEKKLKETTGVELFVLDDTYKKHHCDILLNHNIYADAKRYRGLVPESCELRCGAGYTLLREEFHVEKQKGRQNRNDPQQYHVLVAMGGADHTNLNIAILEVLQKFSNIHVHVVTTDANRYLEELVTYVQEHKNITLHLNTQKIAQLMNESDFAIVTPSVTLNEIVFLNVPFIAIQTAENQRSMYAYLLEKYTESAMASFEALTLKQKVKEKLQCLI